MNRKRWAVAELAASDLDLAGTEVVEEDADLEFLEDRNLELLPLPPPADTVLVDTGQVAVCPHCAGERVGFGRYRERDKPRATNQLRNWNHKHGYKGPPYCKACSESFRSHLLRPGRNPRNGCSRMQPCADCAKVLAHFAGQSPADVFAQFDADRVARGAEHQGSVAPDSRREDSASSAPTPTPVPDASMMGVQSPPTRRDSKRRRLATSAVAVALCVVATVSTSWQQSLSHQQGNVQMGATRQLRGMNDSSTEALGHGMAFEMFVGGNWHNNSETQVCCPTCCNKLPAVPPWVPLRYIFPYMATDYSAIAMPSPATLSTAHYADRFLDHLFVFEETERDYYAGSYWDLQHEHQGTLRPVRVDATCGVTTWVTEHLPLSLPGPSRTLMASVVRHLQHGHGGRLLPSPPHMRTGLVLATSITTPVVIAGCAGGWWGSSRSNLKGSIARAAATHFVIRPVLGIALAGLADVLDPSLMFGIRHEV